MQHLDVRSPSDETAATHSPPRESAIPVQFSYTPSDDGVDENLLILLHGLGDTQVPFANLGKQLKLPQTATMALRAPEKSVYRSVRSLRAANSNRTRTEYPIFMRRRSSGTNRSIPWATCSRTQIQLLCLAFWPGYLTT